MNARLSFNREAIAERRYSWLYTILAICGRDSHAHL